MEEGMTIGELCKYLAQFDPNAHVWIIYDYFAFGPPVFEPYNPKEQDLYSQEEKDSIKPGDLIDWEG